MVWILENASLDGEEIVIEVNPLYDQIYPRMQRRFYPSWEEPC